MTAKQFLLNHELLIKQYLKIIGTVLFVGLLIHVFGFVGMVAIAILVAAGMYYWNKYITGLSSSDKK